MEKILLQLGVEKPQSGIHSCLHSLRVLRTLNLLSSHKGLVRRYEIVNDKFCGDFLCFGQSCVIQSDTRSPYAQSSALRIKRSPLDC